MRVLVIGRSGQLARALALGAPRDTGFVGREVADLTVSGAAAGAIAAARPDLVINATAYTAVDRAESEPDIAFRINGAAVGEIAAAAAEAGAALIHVSTDYVFDGTSARPYRETDPVAPANVYGASKLAGERAALAANPRTVVLRTSWVYSPWGRNFVLTMLDLGRTRPRLRIVDDQRGQPTSALDLAEACLAIGERLAASPAGQAACGVYHYAGSGVCSWADLAAETFAQARRHGAYPAPEIERIGTADYPTPARRPTHSALDCGKFERSFGLQTVDWRDALGRVVAMTMKGSGR